MTDMSLFAPDALCAAAAAKAGSDHFGSDSYTAALGPLLHSIEHEMDLNATGELELRERIVNALANRLTLVAWEQSNAELAAAPIHAPVVILGLPRTGSSILHETLAAAPGMRTPLIWELRDFSLVHEVGDGNFEQRMAEVQAAIDRKNALAPGYAAIHFENPMIPMECVGLLALDLVTVQFGTIAYAPTYREYLLRHDARTTYDWHRRGLRFLQAAQPGRQWVLKAPMHSLYLDALLATYPDARLIQTHRDPLRSLASQVSLHQTLRTPFSDHVPIERQAPSDIAYTASVIQRALDYRRANPAIEERLCDVAFRQFMDDPAATLERIYAHCGLAFTAQARTVMLGYLEARPRDKYGRHSYTLEQFGLSQETVKPLFADYIARFADYL